MLRPADGGVVIASVTPGSNADIAGLQAGDLILDVDGRGFVTPQDLAQHIAAAPSGKTFFVNIRRAGARATAILVVP
jgi:S1-C subfamily serine protease